MIDVEKLVEGARYSDVLNQVSKDLKFTKILKLDYSADYQGHVDISALLDDGRVFSYYYSYGSCSGCDEWEDACYNDETIRLLMIKEGTFFDSLDQFEKYQDTLSNPKENNE